MYREDTREAAHTILSLQCRCGHCCLVTIKVHRQPELTRLQLIMLQVFSNAPPSHPLPLEVCLGAQGGVWESGLMDCLGSVAYEFV